MKLILKATAILIGLLVISTNALTYEGKGFKIISEKTTQSPGFKARMEKISPKKLPAYANALSIAYNAEGSINEYVSIQGDHQISLANYSSQTRRYTYKYTLSCANAYSHFERTIDINPQGNFSDNSRTYGVVQMQGSGVNKIIVETQISGAETASQTAYGLLRIRS